jgi:hypothetical protein
MSANNVSPPIAGTSIARSTDPSDGRSRHVTSWCQMFSTPIIFSSFLNWTICW